MGYIQPVETIDFVIPEAIRNPVFSWMPSYAGMTPLQRCPFWLISAKFPSWTQFLNF